MLRKLLITGVASLGLLSPLAFAAPAVAHEYHRERYHEREYRVYYRDGCRAGWVCGGTFRHHREAERCAERYRCRGFEIEIR